MIGGSAKPRTTSQIGPVVVHEFQVRNMLEVTEYSLKYQYITNGICNEKGSHHSGLYKDIFCVCLSSLSILGLFEDMAASTNSLMKYSSRCLDLQVFNQGPSSSPPAMIGVNFPMKTVDGNNVLYFTKIEVGRF